MRSTPTVLNAEAAGAASRLADLVKLAHLSACLGIPPSYLSAPPTVLPLSSFCSRSAALACSHPEPWPLWSFRRCCASLVRRPNVSRKASSGLPILSWSRRASGALALSHGARVLTCTQADVSRLHRPERSEVC